MNATITMLSGKSQDLEISKAEMARRLELFEIAQREETIAQLKQTLKQERDSALEKANGMWKTLLQQESDLELLKGEITSQHQEIKRLKALEPDRLTARVKRLKNDKDAQKEAINELRTSNKKLRTDNRKLADALDNAIQQINSDEALKPLKVIEDKSLGRFEIYGTESVGHYTVMDATRLTNQQVEILPAGTPNAPRPRPIPKAILNQVSALHTQLIKNAGALA
jgi:DNA repair exonuclease SbcCD ATPase subunit